MVKVPPSSSHYLLKALPSNAATCGESIIWESIFSIVPSCAGKVARPIVGDNKTLLNSSIVTESHVWGPPKIRIEEVWEPAQMSTGSPALARKTSWKR